MKWGHYASARATNLKIPTNSDGRFCPSVLSERLSEDVPFHSGRDKEAFFRRTLRFCLVGSRTDNLSEDYCGSPSLGCDCATVSTDMPKG